MIKIKSKKDLIKMRESGEMSARAMQTVLKALRPGISTLELDQVAETAIYDAGGECSFKTVEDYAYCTCINVNSGIVHGIPGEYKVREGDVVTIDLGTVYRRFHSDLARTVEVGSNKEKAFLEIGKRAFDAAFKNCVSGRHLGDISSSIQKCIESHGYSVSRDLVGHGVGRDLHEDPFIPGYGNEGRGVLLKEGMVFAIEVIYQKGKPELALNKDGWTLETKDGSLSAVYENTVAILKEGPQILTDF